MKDKLKHEMIERLALACITLKSVDLLSTELLATINHGDSNVNDITESILKVLSRASQNFRYIQTVTEEYNASRNIS